MHSAKSTICEQFQKFFNTRNHQYKHSKNPQFEHFVDFDTFFKKDFEKFHAKLDERRGEKIMFFLDVDLEYDKETRKAMKGKKYILPAQALAYTRIVA